MAEGTLLSIPTECFIVYVLRTLKLRTIEFFLTVKAVFMNTLADAVGLGSRYGTCQVFPSILTWSDQRSLIQDIDFACASLIETVR